MTMHQESRVSHALRGQERVQTPEVRVFLCENPFLLIDRLAGDELLLLHPRRLSVCSSSPRLSIPVFPSNRSQCAGTSLF
jgi:hypothetical protein